MSVAFIFPGQGSQSPGMLHHLLDHPAVVRTLDEISEVLHSDVRNLDSEHCLKSDVSVQLALLAAGVATARVLMEQHIEPAAVSGLSVGAFAAAVTADVLSLQDAVELVRLRAEQMMKLYPDGYGLSAIVGLNESLVTNIVQAVTSVQNPVFVGNINAPRQIVIAGSNLAMDQVLEEARRQGASKAVRLHVSVPSHCPLLQPVADLLGQRMSSVNLTTPRMTYVGNVNARAMRTKEMVARDLVNNIAHGVRWHDATTVLQELGCKLFLEMPPGHTLSDLAVENIPGVNSVPVDASMLPKVLRLAQQEEASNDSARNS
ncbi:MAG TPA: malonate decarboxylase subunit epsilon [Terriglobales bacterium]|nr:malonate decarboxylase subunit epsilon [Terriglobales bacterium]